MHTSVIILLFVFVFSNSYVQAKPFRRHETVTPSFATFLKPKASIIRRINPLKLFFTVVHTPNEEPAYKIEWNLPFLKTMFLESKHVTDVDKRLFLEKFMNKEKDYSQWTQEEHDELERFTEKYLNLYESADSFLPFLDCAALTYAITDELLNDLQPHVNEDKRAKVRAKSVERLCNFE